MTGSRMVDAVNRLLGTLLLGPGEVSLPGVGSLYTERQGAKKIGKGRVVPPCRVVSFTSQPRGASLVDEIAQAAGVDTPKAAEIYETWLARTRDRDEENMLTIEGVGILKYKSFTSDPQFDHQLNPAGHAPVKVASKRRFDWALWAGIAAILIAAGFGGYQFLMMYPEEPAPVVQSLPRERATEPVGTDSLGAAPLALPETADTLAAGEPVSDRSAGDDIRTVLSLVPGRSYAVLGVFSTSENALRAVEQTLKKEPLQPCRIYRSGEKYLISAFESDDAAACARFIEENRDRLPGIWTYTAR